MSKNCQKSRPNIHPKIVENMVQKSCQVLLILQSLQVPPGSLTPIFS